MAQKTNAELTTEANVIKNETADNANTAVRIGDMYLDIIDSKKNNDEYLVYTALLSYSSSTVTVTVLKNTLGTDLTWDNPSTGQFRGVPVSGSPFVSNKTWINNGSQFGSSNVWFVTSSVNIGLQEVYYKLYLHDGTSTGTPNINNYSIEIRVYP